MMNVTTPAIDACKTSQYYLQPWSKGNNDTHRVQLRQILASLDVYPWFAQSVCKSCITRACMA